MASIKEFTPKERVELYTKAERYQAIMKFERDVIKIIEERRAKRRDK